MVKRKRSDVPEDKSNNEHREASHLGTVQEEGAASLSDAVGVTSPPVLENTIVVAAPKTQVYEGANTRNRTQQLLNKSAASTSKTGASESQEVKDQQKGHTASTSGQRTSSRNVKKSKTSNVNAANATASSSSSSSSHAVTGTQNEGKKGLNSVKQENLSSTTKTRRSWELWTVDDTNAFFEALCEYGKDFDSIQSYMAQRTKKKGIPARMWKNKEQVRHFYYRTWHKISKHLTLGEDVKKETQELYGLINYARLRKKMVGGLNQKNMEKLNELVLNGVTLIKFRGKRYRIKTPVCKALKKLNNVEEVRVEESLPSEICLEFQAATNSAWVHVQSLAQNPRLRTTVSLQKRLSSVIEYLEKRWQPHRQRLKEQVLSCLPVSSIPSLPSDDAPRLWVRPRHTTNVASLSISTVDVASSSDVCLEMYKKNVLKDTKTKDNIKPKRSVNKLKTKSSALSNDANKATNNAEHKSEKDQQETKEQNTPGISSKANENLNVDDASLDPADEAKRSLSLLNTMLQSIEEEEGVEVSSPKPHQSCQEKNEQPSPQPVATVPSIEELCLPSQPNAENMTLGELLGLAAGSEIPKSSGEQDMKCASEYTDCEMSPPGKENTAADHGEGLKNDNAEHLGDVDERIRKGWTAKEAGMMTIGELYLMLKQPSKIVLEYDWVKSPSVSDTEALPVNSSSSTAVPMNGESSLHSEIQTLSKILKGLLLMASTTFSDWKNKQQTPVSTSTSSTTSSSRVSSNRGGHHAPGSRVGGRASHASGAHSTKSSCSNAAAAAKLSSITSSASSTASSDKPDLIQDAQQKSLDGLDARTISVPTAPVEAGQNAHGESHVFVMPVGTAPRNTKVGASNSADKVDPVKDRIEKLIPPHFRRGRMRNRKPLMVRHPLLPRNVPTAVSSPRPMAVVRLLPSSSQLGQFSAVIPTATSVTSQFPITQAKKVVKIVSTTPTIDVGSIHVPLLKSTPAGGLIPAPGLNPSHVVVSAAPITPTVVTTALQPSPQSENATPVPLTLSSLCNPQNAAEVVPTPPPPAPPTAPPLVTSRSSPTMLKDLSLNVLTTSKAESISDICITTSSQSPPQISIPETPASSGTSLSPPCISSFLGMSISEGLPSEGIGEQCTNSLLDFESNSNSSLTAAFGLSPLPSKSTVTGQVNLPMTTLESDLMSHGAHVTPPHSPTSSHFKFSSPGPENQWLNGESGDISLSSLFTMDSPCKSTSGGLVSATGNLPQDTASMDAIARLGPDVETHLQCLLNENSVDYVAKFADLAAQITASGNENKTPS